MMFSEMKKTVKVRPPLGKPNARFPRLFAFFFSSKRYIQASMNQWFPGFEDMKQSTSSESSAFCLVSRCGNRWNDLNMFCLSSYMREHTGIRVPQIRCRRICGHWFICRIARYFFLTHLGQPVVTLLKLAVSLWSKKITRGRTARSDCPLKSVKEVEKTEGNMITQLTQIHSWLLPKSWKYFQLHGCCSLECWQDCE